MNCYNTNTVQYLSTCTCGCSGQFHPFLSTVARDRQGGRKRERLLDLGVVDTGGLSSFFSLKCVCECGQDFGSCPDVGAQLKSPDKRHFLKFVCLCVCICAVVVA